MGAKKPGAGCRLRGYEQKQKNNSVRGQNRLSAFIRSRRGRTRLTEDMQEEHTLSLIVLMSSGRLFLEQVGRHHSPSPLHRHGQINTRFSNPQAKGDISTLPGTRHFYFALTLPLSGLTHTFISYIVAAQ
jgi:hypothetical protein